MKIGFNVDDPRGWAPTMDWLQKEAGDHQIIRGKDACAEALPELDAILTSRLSQEDLDRAKNLRAIFLPMVGVNHMPLDLFKSRGMEVFNSHGNAESVAERALGLTLAGLGRIIEYHNGLLKGQWRGFWVNRGAEDNWRSIRRMPVTILGVGAIAQALARMLKAFDCPIKGWRRRDLGESIPHFDWVGVDLRESLQGSQLVYNALPSTSLSRGIIDAQAISWMPGAFFVNIGRADTVEEEALYTALRDGRLSGAGLDVWYHYPKPGSGDMGMSRFPIWELENVVLSPHVAGATDTAHQEIYQEMGEVVLAWLQGRPKNKVDLDLNY